MLCWASEASERAVRHDTLEHPFLAHLMNTMNRKTMPTSKASIGRIMSG